MTWVKSIITWNQIWPVTCTPYKKGFERKAVIYQPLFMLSNEATDTDTQMLHCKCGVTGRKKRIVCYHKVRQFLCDAFSWKELNVCSFTFQHYNPWTTIICFKPKYYMNRSLLTGNSFSKENRNNYLGKKMTKWAKHQNLLELDFVNLKSGFNDSWCQHSTSE